ncbi:hypothetical protein [Pseudacidovorax sp. NFM-22]|uniref:hypothetical protein n=1 Tax=Pseudacidovorax sp. NFM-22 TaxID=2744469 RepID=UPI001F2398E5|nr:hypothetical protein [Pseudacidovorax sp. NFM-22]
MVDIGALASSLTGTLTIAKAIASERDAIKLAELRTQLGEKIIESQGKLLEAQSSIQDQLATISLLRKEIDQLRAERNERQRYDLAAVGEFGNFFAYKLRPASELVDRATEPQHFLCQPCFDGGRKSVLLLNSHSYCSICKQTVQIKRSPPAPPNRSRVARGISRDW